MVEDALPDWVKRKKREIEGNAQRAKEGRDAEERSRNFVRLGGPAFWKDLARELTINVDAVKELGVHGEIERTLGGADGQATVLTVTISAKTPLDKHDAASLSYQAGDPYIQLHRKGENPANLEFVSDTVGNLSIFSRHGMGSPRQLAEGLVQSMVETIVG